MTETTASPLDSMLCFAVYSAANATVQAHRAVLAPWDLTYTQYLVLVLLADAGEGLPMRDLGDRLSLDSGTLSPLVRRLERRGLLTRQRSAGDERLVDVALTDAGRTAHAELTEAIGCLAPAYGVASADELEALIASLQGLATGMRAAAADARRPS
ncbi:MarR family winged helix-turn-helix transcriptional regulator [Cnuibacter sp. UC19_7]|uniref:MarR family winged helix-turn-helix transcriptional regulator n=1 Tax=Cnuibacter sp. UC19_7 TaxID=3350166 RepID=UPI00366A752D